MDMARVEAGLFMIEVDYTSTSHAWIEPQKSSPFELGLDWTVALDKQGYFVGRRALEREKREGSLWKLMGLEVEWDGMERLFKDVGLPPQIPGMAMRGSLPIFVGNVQVGYSSTSTWSPLLKKYIALAHLQKPYYEVGTKCVGDHSGTSPPARRRRWSSYRSMSRSGRKVESHEDVPSPNLG
jgi:aminomethyltransferase